MKAVIPAAGLGSRFLPATKSAPKEMLPLIDKPTIQYVVEEAVRSGCDDIIIVTGRSKRAIENHFDRNIELEHYLEAKGKHEALRAVRDIGELANVHYIRQKEPRGLGDAIYQTRRHIGDEPFAVLLGDDVVMSEVPCIKQLMDHHEKTGANVLAVERVPMKRTRSYGIVAVDGAVGTHSRRILDLVEKPDPADAPSDLGILGRYVLTPRVFDAIKKTPPDASGEVQLTDALRRLAQSEPLHAYTFEGTRYDLGNKLDWLKTNVEVALGRDDLRPEFETWLRKKLDKQMPPVEVRT